MPRISRLRLASSNPSAKAAFYRDVLGMTQVAAADFQYGVSEAVLSFESAAGTYSPQRSDLYWKIAIAVPDLDLACTQLRAAGVSADGPRQFQDVGYLAHIRDPEGFQVELIQHGFSDAPKPPLRDPNALGGGPCLNLITLRTSDIGPVRALCEEQLGMTLLCVEPVETFGFTLFFFAFTDETRPNPDPRAVVNRTWTYQRPYTVLEVQHRHESSIVMRNAEGAPGYRAIEIEGVAPLQDGILGITDG